MFSKILVPLAGTLEAAVALPVARTLARATGAAITLLRVASSDRMNDAQARHKDGHQTAEDDLRLVADELARDNLKVDWSVRAEPVAESIIQAAQMNNVDAIVMATHGRTGLGRAFLGSVSERVLADSQRAVVLVKPDGKTSGAYRDDPGTGGRHCRWRPGAGRSNRAGASHRRASSFA